MSSHKLDMKNHRLMTNQRHRPKTGRKNPFRARLFLRGFAEIPMQGGKIIRAG
jgi:hypothetical protein